MKRAPERGFILVVGLLFMVILTTLAITMFRSFGLQERIAGNVRDKQRALEAAESALRFGENWLAETSRGTGVQCGGVVDLASTTTLMRVCSEALEDPQKIPWAQRMEYKPPKMTVVAGGGVTPSGDINYNMPPSLHIAYLGASPSGLATFYQVSAAGYGGDANTVAVVQSVFQVTGTAWSP